MSAKRQRNNSANLQTKKCPHDLTPEEQKSYTLSVGREIEKLLEKRGCFLDVQPGLSPMPNGQWAIGVMARVGIKPKADRGIPE